MISSTSRGCTQPNLAARAPAPRVRHWRSLPGRQLKRAGALWRCERLGRDAEATIQRGGLHPSRAAASPGSGAAQQPPTFMDVMNDIFNALAQQQLQQGHTGAHLCVRGLSYQPPGAPQPLLNDINLTLAPNTLGIIFGRSGAGKTTLLQTIAGLAEPSSGIVSFTGPGQPPAPASGSGGGSSNGASASGSGAMSSSSAGLPAEQRMAAAGLVFQFPERHFIGRTLGEELTVGWPQGPEWAALAARASQVLAVVGLSQLPIDVPLASLSDGYKRRVALAVQLVRRPALLLLDEPLAGLDWRTRNELITLLRALKSECTMLVVSHDLRELAPLADSAWCMRPGGRLEACPLEALPVGELS